MAVATKNKRKERPVTVFQAVQRERSRPFQGKVREYQQSLRERQESPNMSWKETSAPNRKVRTNQYGKTFLKYTKPSRYEVSKRRAKFISEKTSSGIQRGLSLLQRGGVARRLYGQPVAPYGSNIPNVPRVRYTGRRGRPVGTVKYKDAQGNPIDVYTWRKMQAQARWKERQAYLNAIAVTPSQRAALEQIRRQQQYQQINPEGKIIPDTSGFVQINNIMEEADSASHIFD